MRALCKCGIISFFDIVNLVKAEMIRDEDIPPDIIIELVELLGGALLWIIPHPITQGAGTILIGDGLNRIGDGMKEIKGS